LVQASLDVLQIIYPEEKIIPSRFHVSSNILTDKA
jgi:hypothetical protein